MKNSARILSFIFLLIVVCSQSSPNESTDASSVYSESQQLSKIGEYITGNLGSLNHFTTVHYFQIDEAPKKYLFLQLQTHDELLLPSISIYDINTKKMIKYCEMKQFNECFIPYNILSVNMRLGLVVSANSGGSYNLVTYWSDIEHLNSDQDIEFVFGKQTNQLMEIDLTEQNQDFSQIRIILSPETFKADFDKLKIYVSFGQAFPNQEEYDLISKRVWKDSEAIFIAKDQVKGLKKIKIYIVGNANKIYNLRCQYITETSHDLDLNQVVHEYLQDNQTMTYTINKQNIINPNYDEYALKFSVFSGDLMYEIYQDSALTKKYSVQPLRYMNDIEYIFTKEQFQKEIKVLYLKVTCHDHDVIYQLQVQGRTESTAFSVEEDIYEFILLSTNKKALYFTYPVFNDDEEEANKQYSFEMDVIKVMGSFSIQFYSCQESFLDWRKCIDFKEEQKFENSTKAIPSIKTDITQEKTKYTLKVANSDFQQSLSIEKSIMIIAIFKLQSKKPTIIAAQWSNPNKVKQLREDRAIEQKIFEGETKIYKFVNSDKNVKSINIYYNHISGYTRSQITRKHPNLNETTDSSTYKEEKSSFLTTITEDLQKPIYLSVIANANSIYTLNVIVNHREHTGSALVLAEDQIYKIPIEPFESTLVEIHPIEQYVEFNFQSSGGPIYICEANLYGNCMNSDIQMKHGASGQIIINSTNKRYLKFKISNGFNPKTPATKDETMPNAVKVKMFYHAQNSKDCDSKQVNEVYHQILNPGKCLFFRLPSAADLEISVNKKQIGYKIQILTLCQRLIYPQIKNGKYLIPAKDIQKNCQDTPNDMKINIYFANQNMTSTDQTRYEFYVHYLHMPLIINDGSSLAVKTTAQSPTGPVKTFLYEIVDKKKTVTIRLSNKKGIQNFIGKITNDKYNTQVSRSTAIINSQQSKSKQNPIFKVTPQMMADCQGDCFVSFGVFTDQRQGEQVQFTIQVIFQSIPLSQNANYNDDLTHGSFRYYRYQTKSHSKSMYVKVSDFNNYCSKVYVSKIPYPSSSNYIKYEIGGQVIIQNIKKDTYYFGVQALKDCKYTITVGQSQTRITKMEYGQFYDIKLKKGEKQYLVVAHNSDLPFKILTLQKSGSIKIYANQTSLDEKMKEAINSNQIKFQDFLFENKYRNTLLVDNTKEGYCTGCDYLIVIVAEEITETSIALVGENQPISIMNSDRSLFDQLTVQQAKTIVNYHLKPSGQIFAHTYSGKIKVTISYQGQSVSYKFNGSSGEQQHRSFKLDFSNQTITPLQVVIEPIQLPAVYSFKILDSTDNITLVPGEYSSLEVSAQKRKCVQGRLKNKNEKIYLSTAPSNDYKLSKINLNGYVSGKNADLKKQSVGNIISIEFVHQSVFFTEDDYQICFDKQDEPFNLTALQHNQINILPKNKESLVQNSSQKFILHPNGDFIVDVFVCKGQLDFKYSTNQKELAQTKSRDLELMGIPGQSHAVHLQTEEPIYMLFKSQQATVNWMPLKPAEDIGIGYLRFGIGKLDYQNSFNRLLIKFGGIKKLKQTKSKVQKIQYSLYITDSKQALQEAIMCEKFGDKVQSFTKNVETNALNKEHEIPVTKGQLADKFNLSSVLYFNIVADIALQNPLSQTQNYKFIYYEQSLASELFTPTKLQSLHPSLLILYTFLALITFLILTFVFMKIIVPAIGRLKNRVLVEDDFAERDEGGVPVPPSSERNQIERREEAPETQEQF